MRTLHRDPLYAFSSASHADLGRGDKEIPKNERVNVNYVEKKYDPLKIYYYSTCVIHLCISLLTT